MIRMSVLFLVTGLLVMSFAIFVPADNTSVSFSFFSANFERSSQNIFKYLGVIALIFAFLYQLTEKLLFSKRWSIMHWICFICLFLTVWFLGFFEQLLT